MAPELKSFGIKLAALFIIMPFAGYALMRIVDLVNQAWKSNSRNKKWMAMCIVFGFFAALTGWLR